MMWKKLLLLPGAKMMGAHGTEIWAIREGKVWHQGRKLSAADAATFEIFENGHSFIARDASSVFYAWSRLPKIDRDSFQRNGIYWQDEDHVYFEYETSFRMLSGVDAKNFRYLGGSYGTDGKSAWHHGRKMKNCTRCSNLHAIDGDDLYASDGEQIYFDGKPLRGVDVSQWRILYEYFSGDGKSVYYAERKLPRVDFQSWRPMAYGPWSKDKNNFFYMNIIKKKFSPGDFDKTQAMDADA